MIRPGTTWASTAQMATGILEMACPGGTGAPWFIAQVNFIVPVYVLNVKSRCSLKAQILFQAK